MFEIEPVGEWVEGEGPVVYHAVLVDGVEVERFRQEEDAQAFVTEQEAR